MKRAIFCAVILCVIALVSGHAGAVTNKPVKSFADWEEDPWGTGDPVTLKPNGSSVTIKADGSGGETWGGLYKSMKGTVGMKATIRVTKVTEEGNGANLQIGIMNSLGTIDGKRIQVKIYVNQWAGRKTLRWEVIQKDKSGNKATLAVGYFGGWEGAWSLNKDVTVSFKRVGSEIWFDVAGSQETIKWKPAKKMTPLDWSPEIFGYAGQGENSIAGVIKNVSIIYP